MPYLKIGSFVDEPELMVKERPKAMEKQILTMEEIKVGMKLHFVRNGVIDPKYFVVIREPYMEGEMQTWAIDYRQRRVKGRAYLSDNGVIPYSPGGEWNNFHCLVRH